MTGYNTLTKAERMKRYRAKLKEDPKRNLKALKYDRKRKKCERKQEKLETSKNKVKLEKKRKTKRDEMRLYRQRQKVIAEETGKRSKAAIKRENLKKDKLRKTRDTKNREIKTEKKKLAVKKTQAWRMRVKLINYETPVNSTCSSAMKDVPTENMDPESSPFTSRWSERRVTRRLKNILPKTPEKRAHLVEKLMDSPRTSKILSRKGRIMNKSLLKKFQMGQALMASMKTKLNQTKSKGTGQKQKLMAFKTIAQLAAGKLAKRYHVRHTLMTNLAIRKQPSREGDWWKFAARKRRKDRIPEKTKSLITDFFLSAEISRENPGKRYVMEVNGCKIQRHSMTLTLRDAYSIFKERYPDEKVGFTAFRKMKPMQVSKVSETNRRTCLCMQCCNFALKVEAIHKLVISDPEFSSLPSKKEEIAKMTLCGPEAKDECYKRTCKDCSTTTISKEFGVLQKKSSDVKWAKWEYINLQTDGKMKRVVSCVTKETTVEVLLKDLEKDLETYPAHMFRARWQQRQMQLCVASLTSNEAMMVMDYAENYSCRYRDEIATAFFDQVQVTIHPMMIYYRQNGVLTKHALIGISDDPKHDSYGVKKFEEAAFQLIKEKATDVTMVHQWSDGCAVQYKAKTAFSLLSQRGLEPDDLKVRRNYFETSHGKNVCDGLGAIVKNSAHQAVIAGRCIIAGAKDLYDHCITTLKHEAKVKTENEVSIRDFVFIDQSSVQRDIPAAQVETLKGTRKVHAAQGTGTINSLRIRELSCYCKGCTTEVSNCENVGYVKSWEIRTLIPVKSGPTSSRVQKAVASTSAVQSQSVSDSSFNKGGFVAIKLGGARKSLAINVYMAEILDADPEEVLLKYMKRSLGGLYVWPDQDDTSWEMINNIICGVKPPSLQTVREQFKFSQTDMENVDCTIRNSQKSSTTAIHYK